MINSEKMSMIWNYLKYQIVTKGLISFIVLPLYLQVMNVLIYASGRDVVSSGDYMTFLMSIYGMLSIFISLVCLVILIAMDINAFIIMGTKIHFGQKKISVLRTMIESVYALRKFIGLSGLITIIYIGILMPIFTVVFNVSPIDWIKIPNFVGTVIFDTPLYLSIYIVVSILATGSTFFYIFTYHIVILLDIPVRQAMKLSFQLVIKNWKQFIRVYIVESLKYIGIVLIAFVVVFAPLVLLVWYLSTWQSAFRMSMLVTLFLFLQYITVIGLVAPPIFMQILTDLFYQFIDEEKKTILANKYQKVEFEDENPIKKKSKWNLKRGIIVYLIFSMIANAAVSALLTSNFNAVFYSDLNKKVIAHRGGGDLAAENSLLGLEKAIEAGVDWSEIDVQRTKDDIYIINHDTTFERVANTDQTSQDLTAKEVQNLLITDAFDSSRPSQNVATLESMIKAAKGRIGLYIELKGETADTKMVDDVVRMVNKYGVSNEVVILSLDYDIIRYTESKYPTMNTGYLYYFSVGDTANLVGDYLIMEEGEATYGKVQQIKQKGKKAIVWTVNTEESMKHFLLSDVDGIITDHLYLEKETKEQLQSRTDLEVLIDFFFS